LSTAEFLFEVGTEEIPARMMDDALDRLRSDLETWIQENDLGNPEGNVSLSVYGTPRRLIVHAELPRKQPVRRTTEKGPPEHVAYEDGEPTDALKGFCDEHGVSPDHVEVRTMDGGSYTVLELEKEGLPTKELINDDFGTLILDMDWPKSMRWESTNTEFVRPIRWAVAFWDDEPITMTVGPVETSTETRGLRFTENERIPVQGPDEFFSKLEKSGVVYDQDERRRLIVEQSKTLSSEQGGEAYLPDDLVNELNYLVEAPTPFVGRFDEEFLELPRPVLEEAMISHQKYVPVRSSEGLIPCFIGVRNGGEKDLETVRRGNEKVIRARLNDAVFFHEKDLEQDFEEYRDQLEGVVFHDELGSLFDKTERMAHALDRLRENCSGLVSVARHSKNDHVTELVKEFPKLQGVMGRIYAEASGWSKENARVIEEHYRPRDRDDSIPDSERAQWLGVIDRLDTLVGFFGIGYRVSGSSDPYGLRRDALGLLRTLVFGSMDVNLRELMETVFEIYQSEGREVDKDTLGELEEFFRDRLYYLYRHEMDARDDTIRAVNHEHWERPSRGYERIQWVSNWRDSEEYDDLYTTAQRIGNITEDVQISSPDPERFEQPIENQLWTEFQELRPSIEDAMNSGDSETLLELLSSLRDRTDRFFDRVMVMSDDRDLRRNRLALLRNIREVFDRVANFTMLERKH